MKSNELKKQLARIDSYRELEKIRDEIQIARNKITEGWKHGPCGQGPFTGNTRESRAVRGIHIWFSETRGGSPAVDLEIFGLHIEAWELRDALLKMIDSKLDLVIAEMEKI